MSKIVKILASFSLIFILFFLASQPILIGFAHAQGVNFCGRGIVVSDLNLRNEPSLKAETKKVIARGTDFMIEICDPVIGDEINWIKVQVNNDSGWISSSQKYVNIEIFTDSSPLTPTTSTGGSGGTITGGSGGTTTGGGSPDFNWIQLLLNPVFIISIITVGILTRMLVSFGLRIIRANSDRKPDQHASFWEAKVEWLIPHLLGWIIVRKGEQVGVIGDRVYERSGFFLYWPFDNWRMNTVSIQEVSTSLSGTGVLHNGSKITLKMSIRYSIIPHQAARLLAARSGLNDSIKQSLEIAVTNFIRDSVYGSLRSPLHVIKEQLNNNFRELLPYCKINIEGFWPEGELINKIDSWTTAAIEGVTSLTKDLPQIQKDLIRAKVAEGVMQGKSFAEINAQVTQELPMQQQNGVELQNAIAPNSVVSASAAPQPLRIPTDNHETRLAWERRLLESRVQAQIQTTHDPGRFQFLLTDSDSQMEIVWADQNQPPQVLLNSRDCSHEIPLLNHSNYDYANVTIWDVYQETRRLFNV